MYRALSTVVLLLLASCSGLTARQEALLPAMRLAWPGVSADIDRGVSDGVTTGRLTAEQASALLAARDAFTAALDSGDTMALASISWVPLQAEAVAGIMARVTLGEASTGVAQSLTERLRNFSESLFLLLERR